MKNDPNTTSVGNIHARDHAINQFLKHKPKEVAEISVNYTDGDGNVKQQKVDQNGGISNAQTTKASNQGYQKAINKLKEKRYSKSTASFSNACSQERWDEIFGKKKEGGTK